MNEIYEQESTKVFEDEQVRLKEIRYNVLMNELKKKNKLLEQYKKVLQIITDYSEIDSEIDRKIYSPENGYTKDYGKTMNDEHSIFDSYIIDTKLFVGQPKNACNRAQCKHNINNYGVTFEIQNLSYSIVEKFVNDYKQQMKMKKYYRLPDYLIAKIKNFNCIEFQDRTKFRELISTCQEYAECYYKQFYEKIKLINN